MNAPKGKALRPDIQGLRAVAVSLVVLFHLDSAWVPGGFVGVDVFFVISGYLITAHLLERPPTSVGKLLDFWGRRIRRLLPASLLVIGFVLVATRLLAPETQWQPTATDARAATFYVVNWALADRAVDYLAAENLPTAVQHFWSLSVEEQFYFFWPLLVAAALALAAGLRLRKGLVLSLLLGAVVTASLAYSVSLTASEPAAAYFVTPTRVWELGVGGLLALALHLGMRPGEDLPRALRSSGALLGLVLIAVAAWGYDAATPFPGFQAALPVLGAALVLYAHPVPDRRPGPGSALALRPVTWLGDVSYSVYLWHWPLIILAPWALDREPRLLELGTILILTLLLAWATERLVEQPFRRPSLARFRLTTIVAAGAVMAVVAGAATWQLRESGDLLARQRHQLAAAVKQAGPCFGAAALDVGRSCELLPYDEIVPAPALAELDQPDTKLKLRDKPCVSFTPGFPTRRCGFGVRPGEAEATVALVGNSHAGHWLPTLQDVAKRQRWHVDTFLASRCAAADIDQQLDTEAHTQACRAWAVRTTERIIAGRPDLVVMSNRISVPAVGHAREDSHTSYGKGYRTILEMFSRAGIPVVVIHDTPTPHHLMPTCIAENRDDYAVCSGTWDEWVPVDPAEQAVAAVNDPRIALVDLNDHICEPDRCYAVVGGVIAFFDGSHMTATFSRTLSPYLEPYLVDTMGMT